jgi:hypothetical protein
MLKLNKELKQELKQLPKGRKGQEKLAEIVRSLGQKYKVNESAVQKVTKANQTMGYRLTQSVKGMGSGMGGMGLMMGLPMLAGFIPGAEKPGSGGNLMSGALTGAATGAGIGMMFPGFGTAIGAAVGGLGGLAAAALNSSKAIKEEEAARGKFVAATIGSTLSAKVFDESNPEELQRKLTRFKAFGDLPKEMDFTAFDSIMELLKFGKSTAKFQSYTQNKRLRGNIMNNLGSTISEDIIQAMRDMGDKEFSFPKVIVDEEGKKQLSSSETEVMKSSDFLSILESKGLLKNIDTLSTLAKVLADGYKKQINTIHKLTEASISRLKIENMMLSAQDKFNQEMHISSKQYSDANNQLKYITATREKLMTQEEKIGLRFQESLLKASEAYDEKIIKIKSESSKRILKELSRDEYKRDFANYMQKEGIMQKDFSKLSLEKQHRIAQKIANKKTGDDSGEYTFRYEMMEFLERETEHRRQIENSAENTLDIEKDRADTQLKIEKSLLNQSQSFSIGFREKQVGMNKSAAELDHQLGGIVATNFRDGLVSGMRAAINQAENLGDVLQGVAMNFLQAIQNAYLTAAANQIVGAIPMPGKSTGGSIRNYSRGGGVPAMVTDGEYVMGRGAVNKYGGAFMHSLNAGGKIPGYSNGGAAPGSALASNFGGGRGYESGRAHQSRAMSGFFYSQSGNVGLGEDRESLLGVLAEEERARQAAAAKKAKKKAFWKQLLGTALSAGVSYGVSSLKLGGGGAKMGMGRETLSRMPASSFQGLDSIKSSFSFPSSTALAGGIKNANASSLFYAGGPIRKYASGGHIAGKSGIDQIPAMLSEGEYVIRASSARQLGKPTLDRINAGKFNDGGSVSPINTSSESGISGGSTNNINISINLEAGKKGSSKTNSSGSNRDPVEKSDSEQSSTMLAEKIKQQVVSVIVEEQRPGGLLSD